MTSTTTRYAYSQYVAYVAAALLFATTAAFATDAAAQGQTKIYVAPFQSVQGSAPDDVAVQTTDLIRSELSNIDALDVLEGPGLGPEESAAAPQAAPTPLKERELKQANKQFEAARRLMDKNKFGRAAREFQKAIRMYNDALESITDYQPIFDSLFFQAICQFRSAQEDKAERTLAKLIRVNPEMEISEDDFPPIFVKEFNKVKKRTMTEPRGSLLVESKPEGARVFLNGKEMEQPTPVKLDQVMRGEHYLRVEQTGGLIFVKKVVAYARRTEKVMASFGTETEGPGMAGPIGQIVKGLKGNRINFEVKDQTKTLSHKIGAEYVLMGGVSQNPRGGYAVHSYLFRSSGSQITALSPLKFDVDMLQASIEVFKLAEEVSNKVRDFGKPIVNPIIQVVPGLTATQVATKVPEVQAQPLWKEGSQPAAAAAPGPVAAGPTGYQPPAQPGPAQSGGPVTGSQPLQPGPPQQQMPPPQSDIFSQLNRPIDSPQQVEEIVEYQPWYKKWWVWTIIGVAVVGGGVATYFIVKPGPPENAEGTVYLRGE